ncbi:hypothetical protein R75461_08027 [Paraburkholderia nemoris]|uniref:hypothetical protein n=1 Tax=Paraburkholderia nemoris TaxID=2793076 RepID=UPI001B2B34EC|nr:MULTISPECIES: hypothetical protein [Paraburkholderia]CAE6861862.1 hypothetical protein R75461_08027 [Paraburkholderia nemoris]
MSAIAFTILGEAASKANSRDIVSRRYRDGDGNGKSHPMSIRSKKALAFERYALRQTPPNCRVRLVRIMLRIFYASERPDLDESVVLDVLQDRYATVKVGGMKVRELVYRGVYMNDRQVREKHVYRWYRPYQPAHRNHR